MKYFKLKNIICATFVVWTFAIALVHIFNATLYIKASLPDNPATAVMYAILGNSAASYLWFKLCRHLIDNCFRAFTVLEAVHARNTFINYLHDLNFDMISADHADALVHFLERRSLVKQEEAK